jgi:hypothetical protein
MIISPMIGDVDGCAVQPISQSQFTPLPEALCWVIWELNLAERSTGLEDVVRSLSDAFPDLVPPTHKVVYDTLGKLIRERKVRPVSHIFSTRSATFNLFQNSSERRAECKLYK